SVNHRAQPGFKLYRAVFAGIFGTPAPPSMTATTQERGTTSTGTKPRVERRRTAAQRVREARDRLTSSTGTRPAFDYELLRQFAQNRLSASLAILLLVGTIGFLSGLSTDALPAGVWTAG